MKRKVVFVTAIPVIFFFVLFALFQIPIVYASSTSSAVAPDAEMVRSQMPMSRTMPMGQDPMAPMMGMMMQMMGHMQQQMGQRMGDQHVMTGTVPMTGAMSVDHRGLGNRMVMMGMMMQMMGHMQNMMQSRGAMQGMGAMPGMMDRMGTMTDTMPMAAAMPMTGTMSMGDGSMHDMMAMMGMMMHMMGNMAGMGSMSGAMPMTGTMSMGGGGMHDTMAMMGTMMQMMGHMQTMMAECEMMSSTSTATPEAVATSRPETTSDLTQETQAGAITVKVKPLNLHDAAADSLDFEVVLETHSVELDFELREMAVLRVGAEEVAATGWAPSAAGGHHVSGILSFGATTADGEPLHTAASELTMVIRGLPDAEDVTFTWELMDH
jgi:hypothetical protein